MYPFVQEIGSVLQDMKDHLDQYPDLTDVCTAGVRRCAEIALAAWRGARGILNFLKQYQQEPEIYTLLLQQVEAVNQENTEVNFFSAPMFFEIYI